MGKITSGTWGFGRPAKAGPGRPKGSKSPPAPKTTTGFAARPRPGPGRPKGKKNVKLSKPELRELVQRAPGVAKETLPQMMETADYIHAFGLAKEAEKPGSGIPYLTTAFEMRKGMTRYFHSPKAAEPHALPKSDVPNVVRVPLPAQSAEAWQAEADLWRAQQAKFKVGDSGTTIN